MHNIQKSLKRLFEAELRRTLTEDEYDELREVVKDYCPVDTAASRAVLQIVEDVLKGELSEALFPISEDPESVECLTNIFSDLSAIFSVPDWDDCGESIEGTFHSLGLMLYVCREAIPTEYAIRPKGTLEELNAWLIDTRQRTR